RVSAGELVARLEETAPAVRIARAPAPADAAANVARERAEAGRLRRRLQQVRSRVQRLSAAAPPAERTRSGSSAQARAAVEQTAASVERAQRMLAVAAGRRRVVDQQYEDRRVSRFQFHLARSRELVAEVELRRAEEEADAARQALAASTVDERPAAAVPHRPQ